MSGLKEYTNSNKIKKCVIDEAIFQAKLSTHQHRIGAVIFKGKRIIASAHNAVRANKVPHRWKNFYESSHAEAKCIIDARRTLKGYSILVIRLGRNDDNLVLAKPCEFCQGFIDHVQLKDVFYSTNDSRIITEN